MLLNPESKFFKERIENPASYMNKIRHTELQKIEAAVSEYFSISTEYFLGIDGTSIFQTRDPHLAGLYIINGVSKAPCPIERGDPRRAATRETQNSEIDRAGKTR